jgi:hypothetical protein
MSSIFGRRRAKTKCQFWFNLASINVSFECALNPKSHLYAEMVVFVERYRPPPQFGNNCQLYKYALFRERLYTCKSRAIYKCNFNSANLQVQFTTAIYKPCSTTGQMPTLV